MMCAMFCRAQSLGSAARQYTARAWAALGVEHRDRCMCDARDGTSQRQVSRPCDTNEKRAFQRLPHCSRSMSLRTARIRCNAALFPVYTVA